MKEQKQFLQLHSNSFRIKPKVHRKKMQVVSHYKIGDIIGRGGFANVHKAVEINTKAQLAVKVIQLEGLSAKDLQHLRRQIFIHRQLNHPNIVRIYETIWTDSKVYIFMELVKGEELFDYVRKHGPLPEITAAKIFYQIVMAVQYLHSLGIAHRDIKTQNIIIDSEYNAKLIDFGLAKAFHSSTDDYLQTFCGSPSYTAPQLLEKRKYSGQRVDIWCLGVTLYVLLQACLPFDDFDKKLRERNIHYLNWHKPLYSASEAVEIYQSIFTKEKQRMSIQNLLNSPFFIKNHLNERNFQSKLQSKEVVDQQKMMKIITKVSYILNVEEDQVRIAIRDQELGEVYCVYQLCLNMKDQNEYQVRKRGSKSETKTPELSKPKYNTLDPKSQRARTKEKADRPLTPHTSDIIKILPVIHDNHHRNSKVGFRNEGERPSKELQIDKYHLEHIDVVSKDDIAKDALKRKTNIRFKNIFSKDIDIKVTKPRLRDDSPDSPKRLLDCVKRYN